MSEVVIDTGGRAMPAVRLEDSLPYVEVIHYAGDIGLPQVAILTPKSRYYQLRLGNGAVTVRVAMTVPDEPENVFDEGEGKDVDKWPVYFAAQVSTSTDTEDFGSVDDWGYEYPEVNTNDPGAVRYYQYPVGGSFSGPTITISCPCRKMVTINDHPRYPDYASTGDPVRWGKQVGAADEVIDLRDWRGASVDWWWWPTEDEQISVTISMGGMAPLTFTTTDIWQNRADLTPGPIASPVVDAYIRHSGAIIGDNEMWNIHPDAKRPWQEGDGDLYGWNYLRFRPLPATYEGTIKLDAFNGGPNWQDINWAANMRAFYPFGGSPEDAYDYGMNCYVSAVMSGGNSLKIRHESYSNGEGIEQTDWPSPAAGPYDIHLEVDPAIPVVLTCQGKTLPDGIWPEDAIVADPFGPVHPDPPVLGEVVTRYLHATVDSMDEPLTLPTSGTLSFGGRVHRTTILFGDIQLIDLEVDDRPKTQAGEDGVRGYQFAWAFDPADLKDFDVDPNCWRVVMYVPGLMWPALRRRVYESFTIEDFASGVSDWEAVGTETVSTASGKLKIEGANPKAVAKTYEPGTPVFWDSFRFLAIQCTPAAADVELTVTIGTKTWTVTGDATGKFTVDLCAPSNASGIDYSMTRYEREYADGKRELSEGGWGWGLNGLSAQTVQLSFATADDVLIDTIHAALKMPNGFADVQYGTHQCVTVEDPMRIEDTEGENPLEQWAQPVISTNQTGKVTIMEEAGYLTDNPSPGDGEGPQTKTVYTIKDVSDNIHGARDDDFLPTPVDRGRLKTSRKGLETVEALGLTTRSLSTAGTLSYYAFADYCNQCAEAYNLTHATSAEDESGVYSVADWTAWIAADWLRFGPGTAEPILVQPILGGSIAGIVHGVSTPVSGLCPVQLVNPADADDVRDETTTDTSGVYMFPNTVVPIDLLTSIVPDGQWDLRGAAGITTSWGAMLINGVFTRVCLVADGSAGSGGLTMVKTSAGRIYRAYTSGTKIKFDVYTVGARTWSTAIDLCDGAQPSLLMYDSVPGTKRTRELYCYYVRDGQIRRRKSVSEGQTWGAEDSSGIMATKPFLQYDPDTSTTYFLYYDAGTIKFQLSYDHGTTWSVPANVVSASDDFMSLQLAYEPDSSGKRKRALILSYIAEPGAVAVKKSFDDGHTWE